MVVGRLAFGTVEAATLQTESRSMTLDSGVWHLGCTVRTACQLAVVVAHSAVSMHRCSHGQAVCLLRLVVDA